jgi:hypothetical protein
MIIVQDHLKHRGLLPGNFGVRIGPAAKAVICMLRIGGHAAFLSSFADSILWIVARNARGFRKKEEINYIGISI